jgi:D-amino-acid dehydrogenase
LANGGARVVVVGAGFVGLSCAFGLSRAGADVVVLDEGAATPAASWGNAGHIAIEQVAPLASPQALRTAAGRLFAWGGPLDFRLADVGAWAPWALRYLHACTPQRFEAGQRALSTLLSDAVPAWRRLASSLGRPELLREEGHWVLWGAAASTTAGLAAWGRTETGQARFQPLDAPSLDWLARMLKVPPAGGIRFEGTGQISDPGLALQALQRSVTEAGGEIRRSKVRRLSIEQGRARLVLDDGETIQGERIVVAAGVGSGRLMRAIGHAAPVVAERGYHIEGDATDWPKDVPPIVFEDRSLIVTRFGARLRAAGFVEFAHPASPPDPRKWARLKQHVLELGLPIAPPVKGWMGSRPTLPDYLPAIGVSRRASNLIYAFGHQHLGLTLAATTGEIVATLAGGGTPPTDLSAFDIERFERRTANIAAQSRPDGAARIAA